MAGIDKTYYTTYEEWKSVKDWCDQIGNTQDKYGNKFNPSDFLYDHDDFTPYEFNKRKEWAKEENGEDYTYFGILWNTPTWFDIWLIRNCQIPLIVERLREQYGQEFIDKVKMEISEYDLYKRNGLGKDLKVNVVKRPNFNYRAKIYSSRKDRLEKQVWDIFIYQKDGINSWNYDETDKYWYPNNEPRAANGWTSNCYTHIGYLPFKTILRKLRSWNLPKDLKIEVIGPLEGQDWILTTK